MVMCELIKEFCSTCVVMGNCMSLRVCYISCHRHHLPNSKSNLNIQLTVNVLWLHIYTGCPGRNVADFGRMFLKLK